MKYLRGTILANQQVNKRYWRIVAYVSGLDEPVRPGQFFHIRCSDSLKNMLRRPFSIYKWNPYNRIIEFLYLVKGEGTAALTEKRPGQLLDMIGPLGHGFSLPPDQAPILLAARGVGVATLNALAQKALAEKHNVFVLISARTRADLLAASDLERAGATVFPVTDEEGTSSVPQVARLAQDLITEQSISAAYTCGSKRLARLIRELAEQSGINAEIAIEARMACGMGECYACAGRLRDGDQIRTVRVCSEGPVFPIRKVVL